MLVTTLAACALVAAVALVLLRMPQAPSSRRRLFSAWLSPRWPAALASLMATSTAPARVVGSVLNVMVLAVLSAISRAGIHLWAACACMAVRPVSLVVVGVLLMALAPWVVVLACGVHDTRAP